jgi:formate hydrogenlyase subunit 6/NADH:ubiquinone oxidoreductase subunit I
MDIKKVGDRECIQCGECAGICPCHAIERKPFKAKESDTASEERSLS